jgi:hypothetical protein
MQAEPTGRHTVALPAECRQHLRRGLFQLWRGYCYAQHAHASPWEFAVSLAQLREDNLTEVDFRWLVVCGMAEHAVELTLPGDGQRKFRLLSNTAFPVDSCFVLTQRGARFFREELQALASDIDNLQAGARRSITPSAAHSLPPAGPHCAGLRPRPPAEVGDEPCEAEVYPVAAQRPVKPHYDARRRVLLVDDRVVKRFRVPARNQELILIAFEEEGWPERIDDPLPTSPAIAPKRRLHDAINSLNRNQQNHLIRFHGNGNGMGIYWERIEDDDSETGPREQADVDAS